MGEILLISEEEYHADPCPTPSLSASMANLILTWSPLHGWYNHPKLNPEYKPVNKEIFDLGRAAHAYLLEGEDNFVVIDAKDWRTKDAKTQRDQAREDGLTPLLVGQYESVKQMAASAQDQIARLPIDPEPFSAGTAEATLCWEEDGVWCRSRLDFLHHTHKVVDDYKTTGMSANPETWCRRALFDGKDLQAAFYLRGVKAVLGVDAEFRFVVQENQPPYCLSVVSCGPDVLMLAEKKVRAAINLWRECLGTDAWPAYPQQVCYAELPPWEESRWLEREEKESTPFFGRSG